MVTPTGHNILIKRIASFTNDQVRIILPDSVQDNSLKAEVVAVGPGETSQFGVLIMPTTKPGDKVYIHPGATTIEVRTPEGSLWLTQSSSVLGIYTEDKPKVLN
jgi:chaperonin GroES